MTWLSLKEQGSSVVETTIGLSLTVTVLSGGLLLIYMASAQIWLKHVAYEALMCLSEHRYVVDCRQEAHKRLTQNLPGWKVQGVQLRKGGKKLKSRIEIRWSETIQLRSQQSLLKSWVMK